MRILNTFLLFVAIIILNSNAENKWLTQHDYGTANEVLCGACEAHPSDPNGGFLIVGFNRDNYESIFIRIDRFGNTLWRKDGTLGEGAGVKGAHYTDDQGFLIVGNFGLTKINSSGDLVGYGIITIGEFSSEYIKRYTTDRYIILYDAFTKACTFNSTTKAKINTISFESSEKYYEVENIGTSKFIFSGENNGTDLRLLRTSSSLSPDGTFGLSGRKTYRSYAFGSAIDYCSDGRYIVACEEKSSHKIKLLKINSSGTIYTSFNYTPSLQIAYVSVGLKKSMGVKQLSDGSFILGGKYDDGSGEDDLFIQLVSSSGSSANTLPFPNAGEDCDY